METETLTLTRDENWEIPVENEEAAEMIIDAYNSLRQKATVLARMMLELEHNITLRYDIDIDEIECEGGQFYYNHEIYRCGDTETFSVYIPVSYLFDPEWERKAKKEITRKRLKEQQEKEAREKEAEERAKKARYTQYLNLRMEFGKDD